MLGSEKGIFHFPGDPFPLPPPPPPPPPPPHLALPLIRPTRLHCPLPPHPGCLATGWCTGTYGSYVSGVVSDTAEDSDSHHSFSECQRSSISPSEAFSRQLVRECSGRLWFSQGRIVLIYTLSVNSKSLHTFTRTHSYTTHPPVTPILQTYTHPFTHTYTHTHTAVLKARRYCQIALLDIAVSTVSGEINSQVTV